jgi:GTP-binding protein EngB required for normal cell division
LKKDRMDRAVEQKPDEHRRADRFDPDTNGLGGVLEQVSTLLEELGEGFAATLIRLREIKERLATQRFHLAVVGQFKRGKSTLLNAFLGEALLPVSILPLTSIPTFLRPGRKHLVRVFFLDDKREEFSDLSDARAADILARYATEEHNPGNKRGVARVEVEHPSPLLSQGVVMIDTPGIGSTFRHNTDATLNFLPQCDAAIFVVSADPPLTEVELEFLKVVRVKVARLFFVMNKIDYLDEDERSRAVEFFKKVIHEQIGFDGSEPVFCISARRGVEAKLTGDELLWQKSGLKELENCLLDFLAREKRQTLQLAAARKALDVMADATMHIRLQCRSLQMPLADLENRIRIFDEKMKQMEKEKIAMVDLLAGDRKRILDFLERQAEESRQRAGAHLKDALLGVLQKTSGRGLMEQEAEDFLGEKIPVLFDEELKALSDSIHRRLQEILQPYRDRLDGLIGAIRRTAAELFDIPRRALDNTDVSEKTHEPYWITHKWNTSISPFPEGFFDRFLPAGARKKRILNRLSSDIEALVVQNVENIRWAALQNLDRSIRRFASALENRLEETVELTRGAVELAHRRRKQREETVQPELQRLELGGTKLANLEELLVQFATQEGANG